MFICVVFWIPHISGSTWFVSFSFWLHLRLPAFLVMAKYYENIILEKEGKVLCEKNWKKGFFFFTLFSQQRASLVAQLVKNPPAMQETVVLFLGQEDPLWSSSIFMSFVYFCFFYFSYYIYFPFSTYFGFVWIFFPSNY